MNSNRIQRVANSVANERSLDNALDRIVRGLAAEEEVALARIWLIEPGDICDVCPMRQECPDQTQCLHLVASDGASLTDILPRWTSLQGEFRRFPLGVRKVGRIGATGESVHLRQVGESAHWVRDAEWARVEQIAGFAGEPLLFRGEILGVIAVFSRTPFTSSDTAALRSFADSAAAAIANARAFEEIGRLKHQLELENAYLREEVSGGTAQEPIVGESLALKKVLQQVDLVAPADASVLIQGETGTGKELIAHRIHARSARTDGPFIKVNCASIPRELFESEFFGHVKGAFTGAVADRAGRFELAHGGTLFLDEVGEIPHDLQAKLLRTLQEGSFERIGDARPRTTDVRVITATNRDLQRECEKGNFRQDLYYRLSVFPIDVPPLRSRREDIPVLAERFLSATCRRMGLPQARLEKRHLDLLREYPWPGNIRELQNVIERGVIVSQGGELQFDLPGGVSTRAQRPVESPVEGVPASASAHSYADLRALERGMVLEALETANGKIAGRGGAADRLGVPPSTLTSKLASLGIRRLRSVEIDDSSDAT